MKVNSIISSNFYNSASKNNMAVKNRPVSGFGAGDSFVNSSKAFQNSADTVSFTGLVPFQKVAPAIQKGISELPVSKALQKQLLKLAGGADTFFAKSKVLIEDIISREDLTPDEKACDNLVLGMVDDLRGLLKGKGWDMDSLAKLLQKEREVFASLDKLQAQSGVAKTDTEIFIDKKIMSLIDSYDDVLQRIEDGSEIPDEYSIGLLNKVVGVAKDIKAADPEGVKQFMEEVFAVKLPFWKK